MKLNKGFEEKLRKLLMYIKKPIEFTRLNTEGDNSLYLFYKQSIFAEQLRKEIIDILDSPEKEEKYIQIDLEEAIKEAKKEKRKSSHENY